MSAAPPRKRVGVLISGRGSNMVSLAEAAQAPAYPAEIALVISNIPDVAGLDRARDFGIATATVDHRSFGKDREAFERAVDEVLRINQIDLIVLAGFMRILTPWFVARWEGRMINIHPRCCPCSRVRIRIGRLWRPASRNMAARCISSCPSSMPAR